MGRRYTTQLTGEKLTPNGSQHNVFNIQYRLQAPVVSGLLRRVRRVLHTHLGTQPTLPEQQQDPHKRIWPFRTPGQQLVVARALRAGTGITRSVACNIAAICMHASTAGLATRPRNVPRELVSVRGLHHVSSLFYYLLYSPNFFLCAHFIMVWSIHTVS